MKIEGEKQIRHSFYNLQSSKTDRGGSKDELGGLPKEREEKERESKVEIEKDVGVFVGYFSRLLIRSV